MYGCDQWGYKLSYFHANYALSHLSNVSSEAYWFVVVWIASVALLMDWYDLGSSPVSREGSYFQGIVEYSSKYKGYRLHTLFK